MSNFTFNCSSCSLPMTASEQHRGYTIPCSHCGENVIIPEFSLETSMQIGGYILEEKLGVGGMGEVWLAHQTAMSRKVALKILSPSLTKNKEFVDQFMREVKMTGRLEHPNVITAFDAGLDCGLYYLAIAYVDGEELEDKLEREGRMSEKDALKTTLGVAKALNYSWEEAQILHRDVKPANIMIDKCGVVKLMDMGISKSVSDDASITQSGTIVGTPHYISPEQAQADPNLDFRTDLYSLGATLFHMVTGTIPFDADSPMGVLTKHITEPLPDPRTRCPKVSEQCAALINIMMAKDRDSRQKSWSEVEKDIRLVIKGNYPSSVKSKSNQQTMKVGRSGKTFAGSRGSLKTQKTSRAPMIITAVLALVLAGSGTFYVLKGKSEERTKQEAELKAKNDEIRQKNKLLELERANRIKKANDLKIAWQEVINSINLLTNEAEFNRAESAIDKLLSIESDPKKIIYAKKIMEKVLARRVEFIDDIMNTLDNDTDVILQSSSDSKEVFEKVKLLYLNYKGSFAKETHDKRLLIVKEYDEKLKKIHDEIKSEPIDSKEDIDVVSDNHIELENKICSEILKGDFEAAQSIISENKKLDFEKFTQILNKLEHTSDCIIDGLKSLKGAQFKIEKKSYKIVSVVKNKVTASFEIMISNKPVSSKKTFSINALPLKLKYKAISVHDRNVASIYVAIKLLSAGKKGKARGFINKIKDNDIKEIFLETISNLD